MNAFKNMSKTTRSNLITYGMVILAFAIMQGLIAAGAVSSSLKGQLVPISAYICLAISLNLVVGISGELSLGHAGFMSVGAFTGVVVSAMLQGIVAVPALRFVLLLPRCGCCGSSGGLPGGRAGHAPEGRLPRHCYPRFW